MTASTGPELGSLEYYGVKLTEEQLEHFGTKGMKWGVRRGKKTSGVTRHRGAVIDRNAQVIAANKKALSGEKYKLTVKLGSALVGKDTMRRNMQTHIKDLNDQNKRLKAGKLNLGDRLDLMTVHPVELLISARPR